MLQLSHNCRYWLYRPVTDMRKSFDSLCGIVKNELRQDILSGDIFVFVNRRRSHIKLLTWEGDGFGLYYKRLEKGSLNVSAQQLMLMWQGISLKRIKYRKRYSHSERKCG